jgi:sulfoxide reductase heme-binding subunit YedZ
MYRLKNIPWWFLWTFLFVCPVIYYFYLGFNGSLGPNPIQNWQHTSGQWAIWMLCATLCITPLFKEFRINLIPWRRQLGLIVFAFSCLHLGVWFLDQGSLSRIFSEIVKRPFIWPGIISFLFLIPLTLTSTNNWMKRMGIKNWKRLHFLVHPILGMVILHHAWSLKTLSQGTWFIQLAFMIFILVWRLKIKHFKEYRLVK